MSVVSPILWLLDSDVRHRLTTALTDLAGIFLEAGKDAPFAGHNTSTMLFDVVIAFVSNIGQSGDRPLKLSSRIVERNIDQKAESSSHATAGASLRELRGVEFPLPVTSHCSG